MAINVRICWQILFYSIYWQCILCSYGQCYFTFCSFLVNSWPYHLFESNNKKFVTIILTREDTSAALDTAWFLSTIACFIYLSILCNMVFWKKCLIFIKSDIIFFFTIARASHNSKKIYWDLTSTPENMNVW